MRGRPKEFAGSQTVLWVWMWVGKDGPRVNPFALEPTERQHQVLVLLLQASEIEFLPSQWKYGSLEGVHARGGVTVDMGWSKGKLTYLQLHAGSDGSIKLLLPPGQIVNRVTRANSNEEVELRDGILQMKKGSSYTVSVR